MVTKSLFELIGIEECQVGFLSNEFMAFLFWDTGGTVNINYLQKEGTTSRKYYANLFVRIKERLGKN